VVKSQKGFTLIELIIVVIIISILARVVYPSYLNYVRKSRRTDAITTLLSIQLAEEKFRYANTQYGTLKQVWGGTNTTPGGYYTLAISNTSEAGYTLSAIAIGTQANDKEGNTICSPLQLNVNNGVVTLTPQICWN
jgi:type IV pilus assembly protein PilE